MARRKGRSAAHSAPPIITRSYRHLSHPFAPQSVLGPEAVADIHAAALKLLSDLGLKILHPEARAVFKAAGATVYEDDLMVFIGPEIVEAALATAPRSFIAKGGREEFDRDFSTGKLHFAPGAGCPNVTDRVNGRRAGNAADFVKTTQLQQHFDAIHLLGPSAEPQDIPTHLRHYFTLEKQLTQAEKSPWVYARGQAQSEDSFQMIAMARGVSDEEFVNNIWCKTVINTNSPRQIDLPMCQGILDFARAGQLLVITPFCLAGAMAPISIAGALMLQHAETLAGITLAQLAKPGAPVMYGGFSSNVDMKSGAPAFGTPEHIQLTIGTGEMARHIGFPFRSAAGSAGVTEDSQSAVENAMGLWANMQANTTLILHSAGWLEGGLTFGYEKFIVDLEAVQTLCEMAHPISTSEDSIGLGAVAEVNPGGHFFDTTQTMERYRTAFYEPLAADLTNHGGWVEAGSVPVEDRATQLWQQALRDYQEPAKAGDIAEKLKPFVEKRTAEGGAPIMGG